MLAAITWRGDETFTVLDLKSGIPQLTIDTGMGIYGLGIVGNTVVIVSEENIITWNIPTGGYII